MNGAATTAAPHPPPSPAATLQTATTTGTDPLVTVAHLHDLLDGRYRDPVLLHFPATGQITVCEIGTADTFGGRVLAVPEELDEPRKRTQLTRDDAWCQARATELTARIHR